VHVLVFELEFGLLAGGRAFLLLGCVLVWYVCVNVLLKWDGNEGRRGVEGGARGKGDGRDRETRLTNSALYARLSAARARDC